MKTLTATTIDNLDNKQINRNGKEIITFLIDTFFSKIKDIYNDIFEEKMEIKYNSIDNDLLNLFKKGKIYIINDNVIKGQFNSKITKYIKEKLGGVYDKRRKQFVVNKLPDNVIRYIKENQNKIVLFQKRLNDFLIEYKNNLEPSIRQMEGDFGKAYKLLADDINNKITGRNAKYIVKASLNDKIQENIRNNYIDNMEMAITNWQEKNIKQLREDVEYWVLGKGYSNKGIADLIVKNYNTTAKKAQRLARNEASLVLSEYSKQKYLNNGITKYRWQTSGDERVRSRHKELNGKVFSFDNPPIVDLDSGRRGNPGEDYFCRCVAIPILEDEDNLTINKQKEITK